VLDFGLVMNIFIIGGLQERRVEDLLLNLRVDPEGLANPSAQPLLTIIRPRGFELLEPLFDLPMIGHQQVYCILLLCGPSASGRLFTARRLSALLCLRHICNPRV